MKKRNEFYLMDKQEAYSFIWECIDKWCKTYGDETGRLSRAVTTLIDNYNTNNLLGETIDYYDYAVDEVNNGYAIGLGIEDEHFIYPEYIDEYNKI